MCFLAFHVSRVICPSIFFACFSDRFLMIVKSSLYVLIISHCYTLQYFSYSVTFLLNLLCCLSQIKKKKEMKEMFCNQVYWSFLYGVKSFDFH